MTTWLGSLGTTYNNWKVLLTTGTVHQLLILTCNEAKPSTGTRLLTQQSTKFGSSYQSSCTRLSETIWINYQKCIKDDNNWLCIHCPLVLSGICSAFRPCLLFFFQSNLFSLSTSFTSLFLLLPYIMAIYHIHQLLLQVHWTGQWGLKVCLVPITPS